MGKLTVTIDANRSRQYREAGFWGDATLLDYWKHTVKSCPSKRLVVDDQGAVYTYKEADERARRLAGYLRNTCGLEEGDVVSVQLPNWAEYLILMIAALKAGLVFNPLLVGFRNTELVHHISKCASKALFIPSDDEYLQLAREVREEVASLDYIVVLDKHDERPQLGNHEAFYGEIIESAKPLEEEPATVADDVAIILFTSGTESSGKGVMLTHNNLIANKKGYIAVTDIRFTDKMLMPVTLAHAQGLMYGAIIPFTMGMGVALMERYNVDGCIQLVEKEHCTLIQGPTVIAYDFIRKVKESPDVDISSLRYFYCGGSPIPRTLVEMASKRGVKVLGVYGATESAPHCIVSPFFPQEKVLTTDGKPIPGVEVRIVDDCGKDVEPWVEGEEYSRGPNVFVGYIDEPELTKAALDEDGWYHSGDLCVMDEDGFIRIVGRKKDIIVRGGENISSAEIEDAMMTHEKVGETAVVAYPDERLGERVCAYVVLKAGADELTLEELQTHMKAKGVAKFKWPERIEHTDKLPRTESGKVQKFKLREEMRMKVAYETMQARKRG